MFWRKVCPLHRMTLIAMSSEEAPSGIKRFAANRHGRRAPEPEENAKNVRKNFASSLFSHFIHHIELQLEWRHHISRNLDGMDCTYIAMDTVKADDPLCMQPGSIFCCKDGETPIRGMEDYFLMNGCWNGVKAKRQYNKSHQGTAPNPKVRTGSGNNMQRVPPDTPNGLLDGVGRFLNDKSRQK